MQLQVFKRQKREPASKIDLQLHFISFKSVGRSLQTIDVLHMVFSPSHLVLGPTSVLTPLQAAGVGNVLGI